MYEYDPSNKEHRAARVNNRAAVAHRLRRVARELAELENEWTRLDFHPDTLQPDEWPFDKALEDMVAEVSHCAAKIEEINDLLRLKPVTITLDAATYDWLMAELDRPAKVNPQLKAMLENKKELK